MMNATQLRYAKERVDATLSEKIGNLRNRYGSSRFSDKDKLAALKKGEFKVNPKAKTLSEAIVYPTAPVEMTHEEYQKQDSAIRLRAQEIKDELILGDQEAALDLIRKFRSE
jgi:hypothetical protein